MAFPAGWARRQKITVDNTKVPSTLSNFPMLITLDHLDSSVVDAGANSALNGGGDLRFSSDEAGATQLACEVVDFVTNATAGNRACEVWVDVASISSSVDTDIYIWYKKAGETQPAVSDTYGRNAVWNDYAVVSHDGGPTDSTGNTTPAKQGSPVAFAGKFTNATDCGGHTDNWFYRATVSDYATFTMQGWGLIDAISGDSYGQGFLGLRNSDSLRVSLAADNSPDDIGVWDDVNSWLRSSQTQETGVWRAMAVNYNGTTDRRVFYQGAKVATDATVSTITTGKTSFDMGHSGRSTLEGWDGKICEARLRPSALADDWITAEFNNQNAPATFATAGTPVNVVPLLLMNQSHGYSL